MSNVVENEKIFEYFGDLFPETRKVVIEEMQPVDRCRFTRCAKFCQKEAKESKNYIYGLKFYFYEGSSSISLKYFVHFDKCKNGFGFDFYTNPVTGEIYKNCVYRKYQLLWQTELDSSTDLIQYGVDEFKSVLQLYQNTIQRLSIDCSRNFPKNFDFGIKSLKNLTKLEIMCDMNLSQIFSKLKKPLEELFFDGRKTTQNIVDFEELYQVQNKITLIEVVLNYEQFTRLSANCIRMDDVSLTEMDIFNLIRSWQNSTDWKTTRYFYYYKWTSIGPHFNFQHLLDHLGIAGFDAQNCYQIIPIRHFKDDQKICKLQYYRRYFTLEFKK